MIESDMMVVRLRVGQGCASLSRYGWIGRVVDRHAQLLQKRTVESPIVHPPAVRRKSPFRPAPLFTDLLYPPLPQPGRSNFPV